MDVALALLPITIIAKLQMPLPKKILLSSLLGLGIFAAVCASIKTFELQSLNARSDITWQTVTLWIWNVNECGTVIIAACIPTLRPLYLIIFRRPGREVYRPNKRSHTYAHGVRKGYVRSGSRRRGWGGNSESTTAIGESNVQAEDTSWLEMGDQKVGKGDIRQTTDVEVERRERRGGEDGDGVWGGGGGGGLGETRIVGPGSVV